VAYVDPSTVVKGTMTDERDGQTYKTVTIGTQTWMAENLNYAYTDIPYKYVERNKVHSSDSTSWCYDNDPVNCTKYGRLYTWAAAMDSVGVWSANGKNCGLLKTCSPTYPVRGICPEGWHLPNYDEWAALIVAVDGSITEYNRQNTAGGKLKSTSGWDSGGNGTDVYAFSALPAGFRGYAGNFEFEDLYTFFWSSTERNRDFAWYMDLHSNDDANLNYELKQSGFSVRCVKD